VAAENSTTATKKQKVLYRGATAVATLTFGIAGMADLLRVPAVTASLQHLGYPMYLLTILGLWKLLGSVAIAVPRLSRLKEWAYAGMFFDLTGAAMSHAICGHPVPDILLPLVLLGVVMISWYYRPACEPAVTSRLNTVHAT
jgi:uncharacterized membrane protein YphA (DoxX/SURF4 family)